MLVTIHLDLRLLTFPGKYRISLTKHNECNTQTITVSFMPLSINATFHSYIRLSAGITVTQSSVTSRVNYTTLTTIESFKFHLYLKDLVFHLLIYRICTQENESQSQPVDA